MTIGSPPRGGLRAVVIVVMALAGALLGLALVLFVAFLVQGPTDEISRGYLVRLLAFGGLPTLVLLAGAGLLAWRAGRAGDGPRLAWAALTLGVGVVWAFVWLGYSYAPYTS